MFLSITFKGVLTPYSPTVSACLIIGSLSIAHNIFYTICFITCVNIQVRLFMERCSQLRVVYMYWVLIKNRYEFGKRHSNGETYNSVRF